MAATVFTCLARSTTPKPLPSLHVLLRSASGLQTTSYSPLHTDNSPLRLSEVLPIHMRSIWLIHYTWNEIFLSITLLPLMLHRMTRLPAKKGYLTEMHIGLNAKIGS